MVRVTAAPRRLRGQVSANEAVTDGIRQITLAVRGLDGFSRIRPGAHVTLYLRQAGGRSAARIYSIWRQSPGGAQLAIRVLLHPQGGPGTVWARNAEVGDEIAIGMPASKITLDQRAGYHVFLGDENGAVPLLAMRAGLAPEVAVYGAFQAFDHRFRVPAPSGVAALPWVEQPHPSGRTTFAALDAARALELPPEPAAPTWPARPTCARPSSGTSSRSDAGRARRSRPNHSGQPAGRDSESGAPSGDLRRARKAAQPQASVCCQRR